MLTYFFDKISFYLGLHRCVFCEKPINSSLIFCPDCYTELPWLSKACLSCCDPLLESLSAVYCGHCLNHQPFYDRAFSLFRYEPPLTYLIPALKFRQQLQFIRILAELLANQLNNLYARAEKPDFLIAVPLHPKRLRERGYNQALEIAKIIHQQCQLPLARYACQRIRYTQAQSLLDARERQKNIKKAFFVHPKFKANHILLIDDVMTTGQTLNELSRVFKQQGVSKIDVACIAKTLRVNSDFNNNIS
jgi:ComF family protein